MPDKAILSLPFKAGLYTFLLGLGISVGMFAPTLWQYGSQAFAWLNGTSENCVFDPDVLVSPEKELNLIHSVNDGIEPRLNKARILIRKQGAEIEYLREKCRFIEERVPRDEKENRTPAQILKELADLVS